MDSTTRDALDAIHATVGTAGCVADPGPYLREWRGHYHGRAATVVAPGSTAEVASVVGICAAAGLAVVPQSGNTGLCGGAAPSEDGSQVLLSLRRMNRIREVDPGGDTLTAEAGCILADVQRAAADVDRLFPLSLAAEGSCMLGGNLATNAGGLNVLRYGNARALCLGLEVVLPDGRIWSGLRRLRKDNSGYDLRDLFIGAEGTLGVITAAVLRLYPRPRQHHTALLAVPDPATAVALLPALHAAGGEALSACELMSRTSLEMALHHVEGCHDPLDRAWPWYVLVEWSSAATGGGLGEAVEAALEQGLADGRIDDAVIAASEAQRRALWRLRESIPEGQTRDGASLKHDVSVPIGAIPALLEGAQARLAAAFPGARPCPFGHLGDGNIHLNVSQPRDADGTAFRAEAHRCRALIHDLVLEHEGSFAAEHGVGQLKADELLRRRGGVELEMMRAIRHALDPAGIMNPGKVVL